MVCAASFPAHARPEGSDQMGTPRGAGVETNLEVRVRFPSVVMEVVRLWGHSRAGGRSDREARRDECGQVVQ